MFTPSKTLRCLFSALFFSALLVLPVRDSHPLSLAALSPLPLPLSSPAPLLLDPRMGPGHGVDVSWPQCTHLSSLPRSNYTIVGVNGGTPFTMNPCLGSEWAWATTSPSLGRALYLNVAMPMDPSRVDATPQSCLPGDTLCLSWNVGWNEATWSLAHVADRTTPSIWLDVETMNHWSTNPLENTAIIRGALAAITAQHFQAGVYSTPRMWERITASAFVGAPLWMAIGHWSPERFHALCSTPLAGNPVAMVQWVEDVDQDLTCGSQAPLFTPRTS